MPLPMALASLNFAAESICLHFDGIDLPNCGSCLMLQVLLHRFLPFNRSHYRKVVMGIVERNVFLGQFFSS
jgi:hypothetical protein